VIPLRPILFIIGLLVAGMGLAMAIPALADLATGNADWRVFAASMAFSVVFGVLLVSMSAGGPIALSVRQGFLLTTSSWLILSVVGALPLLFSDLHLSSTDAFFEAISGLTTTGSTVLTGLDRMAPGILLWRGLLQWIGGIGIIVMGLAILPYLRVGGMHLFRMESSDQSEKAMPRIAALASATMIAYAMLSVACASAYYVAGMTGFEAVIHAMTTISTGGYSTSDASLGHFANPAIHWIASLFMVLGSLPFVIYLRAVVESPRAFWQDSQVRHFLCGLMFSVLLLLCWLLMAREVGFMDALRLATFHVVSIVTTTGYATEDYLAWGPFAAVTLFVLTFVGGCTGSTAGGIKTLRFELAAVMIGRHLKGLSHPHGVFPMKYRGHTVPAEVTRSAMNFFFVFMLAFAALTLGLSYEGLDMVTALTGAATALANVGPGLGDIIGPVGNFASLPDAAKWMLAFGMLLGRLELFTVLVVVLPGFWRG